MGLRLIRADRCRLCLLLRPVPVYYFFLAFVSIDYIYLKFCSNRCFFLLFAVSFFYYYSLFLLLFHRTVASFWRGTLVYLFYLRIGFLLIWCNCRYHLPFVYQPDLLSRSQPIMPFPLPRSVLRSAVPSARGPYLFVPFICWIIHFLLYEWSTLDLCFLESVSSVSYLRFVPTKLAIE
jgi:hypothetical protein